LSASAPITQEPDDFELMQAIAAGDQSALRTLHNRYGSLIYTLAFRILTDSGAAEEVLFDVLWETWNRAERYHPSRGNPRSYLVTLARSRAIDRLRSRQSRADIPVESQRMEGLAAASATSPASPAQSMISSEQGTRVRAALSKLDSEWRRAVELAYYEDMSHREIAEKLNKPLGTVKSWIRQSLIHLRTALGVEFANE
jgi:RNA polymerase sigma-70 factor, ECF subfamily